MSRAVISITLSLRLRGLTITRTGTPRRSASENITPALTDLLFFKMRFNGLDMTRDVLEAEFHDFAKIIEGGVCPECGKIEIEVSRWIESGNIFQLETEFFRASLFVDYFWSIYNH